MHSTQTFSNRNETQGTHEAGSEATAAGSSGATDEPESAAGARTRAAGRATGLRPSDSRRRCLRGNLKDTSPKHTNLAREEHASIIVTLSTRGGELLLQPVMRIDELFTRITIRNGIAARHTHRYPTQESTRNSNNGTKPRGKRMCGLCCRTLSSCDRSP